MGTRELRLVIAQRPTRRDHLHGAWWPHSTNIELELTALLAAVASRFRSVLGVTVNRDEWPGSALDWQPIAASRSTRLSWYGLPEPHLAVLHCVESRRIALLVLPPETPEQIAVRATLMASTPGNGLTTDETLAKALAQVAAEPASA